MQTLVTRAVLCFMVTEKPWPLWHGLQEILGKKQQMLPIKNSEANVNHIIVARFREVYSDLGWLPGEHHDPEAAERVWAKLRASFSYDTGPKIAFAGKVYASGCYITITIMLMTFRVVY